MEIEITFRAIVECCKQWDTCHARRAYRYETIAEEQGMWVAEMINLFKFREFDEHKDA